MLCMPIDCKFAGVRDSSSAIEIQQGSQGQSDTNPRNDLVMQIHRSMTMSSISREGTGFRRYNFQNVVVACTKID
jgi:hypothetical protein